MARILGNVLSTANNWILRPTVSWTMCRLSDLWRRLFGRAGSGDIPPINPQQSVALMGKGQHATDGAGGTDGEVPARFQSMSREEKRRLYKCRDNYNTLDHVLTWPEYYEENKERLQKLARNVNPVCKPDEELNKRVSIWRGDITTLEIDAIVNAANSSLMGGGGVDGAIHYAAGSQLKAECSTLNGCQTGDAKITLGYKLPATHVIHTVGPIGVNQTALTSCYTRCLALVKDKNLTSVAFPCISTGIYGYPSEKATPVAIQTARKWLTENKSGFSRLIFCLFMENDVKLYETLMQKYFPIADPDTATPEAKLSQEEEAVELSSTNSPSGDSAAVESTNGAKETSSKEAPTENQSEKTDEDKAEAKIILVNKAPSEEGEEEDDDQALVKAAEEAEQSETKPDENAPKTDKTADENAMKTDKTADENVPKTDENADENADENVPKTDESADGTAPKPDKKADENAPSEKETVEEATEAKDKENVEETTTGKTDESPQRSPKAKRQQISNPADPLNGSN